MEFEVKDMSCDGCANSISHAVTGADPVAKLDIDVATKVVRIESAPPSEQRRWNRFVGHQQEGTRRLESSE
jgi:copper chaperone